MTDESWQTPGWQQPGDWEPPGDWQQPGHVPDDPPIVSQRPIGLRERIKKAFAPLAGVGALLAKFGALLVKLKALTVVGTMAISLAAYAHFWGWKFAVGFVLLIFVHEMGHVVVLRARGIKASVPFFIPLGGAFVRMKSAPQSVYHEAESAIAGPIVGTAASLLLAYVGHVTGSEFWRSLAFSGLFINLFNLLPALPLDGGRVAGALHPGIWLIGLLGLLGFEIERPSPILLILLVFGGYELYQRWRNRSSAASQVYFALEPGQRARIGAAYLVLIAVIGFGMHATYLHRSL